MSKKIYDEKILQVIEELKSDEKELDELEKIRKKLRIKDNIITVIMYTLVGLPFYLWIINMYIYKMNNFEIIFWTMILLVPVVTMIFILTFSNSHIGEDYTKQTEKLYIYFFTRLVPDIKWNINWDDLKRKKDIDTEEQILRCFGFIDTLHAVLAEYNFMNGIYKDEFDVKINEIIYKRRYYQIHNSKNTDTLIKFKIGNNIGKTILITPRIRIFNNINNVNKDFDDLFIVKDYNSSKKVISNEIKRIIKDCYCLRKYNISEVEIPNELKQIIKDFYCKMSMKFNIAIVEDSIYFQFKTKGSLTFLNDKKRISKKMEILGSIVLFAFDVLNEINKN